MPLKNKNFSVVIFSEARLKNREFCISGKLIRNFLIAVPFLMLLIAFFIYDYLSVSVDSSRLKKLEEEVATKTQLISQLTNNLDSLNRSLKQMAEYKKKIEVATGFSSPNALKEIGSGGGAIEQPGEQGTRLGDDLQAVPPIQDVLRESSMLATRAGKMADSLSFINTKLDEQKVRLAFTPCIYPLKNKGFISDDYGNRNNPITGKREFHAAIDFATQLGAEVIAPADGYVLSCETNRYLGNMIVLDHRFGYSTMYGHLSNFNVKEGDRVKRGDVIGFVGSTGRSNAPHLHYVVMHNGSAVNPLNFILD